MAIALVVAWVLLETSDGPPRRGASTAAPRTIGTLEQSLILDTDVVSTSGRSKRPRSIAGDGSTATPASRGSRSKRRSTPS